MKIIVEMILTKIQLGNLKLTVFDKSNLNNLLYLLYLLYLNIDIF